MTRLLSLLFPLVLLGGACTAEQAGATPSNRVDTILPVDSALARFRQGLPEVTTLSGSVPSLTALMDTVVARLGRSDTAGLQALSMTAAEFGWLYYPTIPEARPPYDLAPDLMWFMVEGNGRKGLTALLDHFGGHPPRLAGWHCDAVRDYGPNRIHAPCLYDEIQARGDTITYRWFGPVIERDGRFKLLNFSNKL